MGDYRHWSYKPEGSSDWVDLEGTAQEKLEKVRAAFGEDFVFAYTDLFGGNAITMVVFYANPAQAWEDFSQTTSHCSIELVSSRGVRLAVANNEWDDVTLHEFHEDRETNIADVTEFLKTRSVTLNYLGLPSRPETPVVSPCETGEDLSGI